MSAREYGTDALFDMPDEMAQDGPYMPRSEWTELDAFPVHAECPLVLSIDTAHAAVVKSLAQGLINQEVADAKVRVLQLRRITIAQTQETFGCPRKKLVDPAEREREENAFNCTLPTGRVEYYGYGNSDAIPSLIAAQDKGIVGFSHSN